MTGGSSLHLSSAMRALNIRHNSKLLGGAEAILLLPEVTRTTFTIEGVSTFEPVRYVLCHHSGKFGLLQGLRDDPVDLFHAVSNATHLLLTSSSSSSTWQHSSEMCTTAHFLWAVSQVHQAQQEAPKHPLQLRAGQAVSSSIAGIVAPVAAGNRGQEHVCCSEKRCWHFFFLKKNTTKPTKPPPKQLTFLHKLLPPSAALQYL